MKSALQTRLAFGCFVFGFKVIIVLRTEGSLEPIDLTALYALLTLYIGIAGSLMFIFALKLVWNGKALEKHFHANLLVKENIAS